MQLIGAQLPFHPDWGTEENQQDPDNYFGIPINVVDGTAATTDWPTVSFDITDPRAGNGDGVPEESDCARAESDGTHSLVRDCSVLPDTQKRFPFPVDSLIKAEYGTCNDAQKCGDRHVLVVEKTGQGACRLWESYFSYNVSGQWFAYSTAAWNLTSLQIRPDGWTSGDAAGLPIAPLLARVDEALAGEIRHALRVTLDDDVISRTHVWPARHDAGSAGPDNGVPFGAVMRLKAGFVPPANWTPQAKAVAQAMQRYGLYVSDISGNPRMFVQGEPSERWGDNTLGNLRQLRAGNFEFVDMRAITSDARFDVHSFQAVWP